jgi:hypothetical protein
MDQALRIRPGLRFSILSATGRSVSPRRGGPIGRESTAGQGLFRGTHLALQPSMLRQACSKFGYPAMALFFFAACSDKPGLSASNGSGGAAVADAGGGLAGTGGSVVGSSGGSGGGSVIADAGANADADSGGGKPEARMSDLGAPDVTAGTDTGLLCGPVCMIFCLYGNVLDDRGCPTCTCNPAPVDGGGKDTRSADAGPPDVGPDVMTCGPVCAIDCQYGNVMDAKGCPTCTCNPPPIDGGGKDTGVVESGSDAVICGPVCDIYCQYGNVVDNRGCETCACNPAPVCKALPCPLCPNGYVKDANGCSTCQCLPDPTTCPAIKCMACPFGYTLDAKGCITCTCVPDPNRACSQRSDEAQCIGSAKCQWLVPGCSTPALSTPGCYDVSALNCSADTDCSSGRICVQRSIDPCFNLDCAACGKSIGICL